MTLLLLLAALIQVRGEPLHGGSVQGSADRPLERASGGDTPVLTFRSPRGPLRLLLDTGATSTMVTPQLVQRLGLRSTELAPSAFGLAGGGSDCGELRPRRSLLPDLVLSSRPGSDRLQLSGVEALVLPVAALPPGIDGVLGAPTLRLQPIWIDPLADRLAFGAAALRLAARHGLGTAPRPATSALESPPTGAEARSSASLPRSLPLHWHQGVPLVGLSTPLGLVPALADTGAEGLFLNSAFAGQLARSSPGRPLRLVGFCGEQAVEQTTIAGLNLAGGIPSRSSSGQPAIGAPMPVIITTNPIFHQLRVEAIVGQELLRHRRQLWRLDQSPPRLELR